jgi:PAS domain S-box-containing protein
VYFAPTAGHPWSVVIIIPSRQAQQLALSIATPLLVLLAAMFFIAAILLRMGIRAITRSLQNLTAEADLLASGKLDRPLVVTGVDEVGQLRRSFEQMRVSLKARLDDLNRLLQASQGVASSLEIERALHPVLEAALSTGAAAVRIALSPDIMPETDGGLVASRQFGAGRLSHLYRYLDDQILAFSKQQDRLILSGASRLRVISFAAGLPRPEALLAFALKHEASFYGTLYLVFDAPHTFTEDEMRFILTLAGHASLAATNTRLFLSAEVGRQRLAAILASTPDPVLVTDHQNRLLLANPAAWHVVGFISERGIGQPIEQFTTQKELISLLSYSSSEQQQAEVTLSDGRVYLATASPIITDGRSVGRVCVMRDVTHFKELDSLKSEFVSTVSHDLRSPLTLMRGYATMLEMVGNLNEQQTGYVRKIVSSVETMSRLVNNLLDLGRIEAGIDLQLDSVAARDVADRVVSALQLQASQKHVHLLVEVPNGTAPTFQADPALIQQALYNLVENAVKYTEQGKVTLRIFGQAECVHFEVQDTGIGIAPVDVPRLFEKFYRGAQREARKQTGTGLGLAIVKSIVERHGGKVWVESQLGKGSTFHLTIPLAQPIKAAIKAS